MDKKKIKKKEQIKALERKNKELKAQLVHNYHFAHASIGKAEHHQASGVIIEITALGGKEIIAPVLIKNGLSKETIAAIRVDLIRSYKSATELCPPDRDQTTKG